jgi:hydroxymethylpyrimidine pyrophosphatase-like HAD family hydrolase
MTKTKLVALDVDGTLVRRDLTISPAVIRAVESPVSYTHLTLPTN